MPLGQQDGTHGLRALVVGGSVLVRIPIPPAGLPSPPSPVPVGAGSPQFVRGESASCSSTHIQHQSTANKIISYIRVRQVPLGELAVSQLASVEKEHYYCQMQTSGMIKYCNAYRLLQELVFRVDFSS